MTAVVLNKRSDVPPVRNDRVVIYADLSGNIWVKSGGGSTSQIGGSAGISLADVLAAYGARFAPAGGTAGQVLKKVDGTDYNLTWGNDLTGGGGGTVTWGDITGTLAAQTDLQGELDGKADSTHTHDVGDLTGGHDQTVTLASGTYSPALTNVANVASSTTATCQYMRVGSVVTVSGKVTVDTSLGGGTLTRLGISLPVSSNLASADQLSGVGTLDATGMSTATGPFPVAIKGDAANNRAEVNALWYSSASVEVWFTFTYLVV